MQHSKPPILPGSTCKCMCDRQRTCPSASVRTKSATKLCRRTAIVSADRRRSPQLVDARHERDGAVPHVARVVDEAVPHLHLRVLEPDLYRVVVDVQRPLPHRPRPPEVLLLLLPLRVLPYTYDGVVFCERIARGLAGLLACGCLSQRVPAARLPGQAAQSQSEHAQTSPPTARSTVLLLVQYMLLSLLCAIKAHPPRISNSHSAIR